MEQRNGRIDRHGQTRAGGQRLPLRRQGYTRARPSSPKAPAGDLEADLEFLMRAAKKVEQIREDLGKVGPVIAEQVEEAMLGKRRRLDTARAERENEPVKRLLRFEQNIRELSRRHADQLDETRRDLHLTPANIEAVVHIALDLARQPPLLPWPWRASLAHSRSPISGTRAGRRAWKASTTRTTTPSDHLIN